MGERMRHRQDTQRLLDSMDNLSQQIEQAIAAANRAKEEGEQVSVLVAELLLGVHAHLTSGMEALEVARSNLQGAMKERA